MASDYPNGGPVDPPGVYEAENATITQGVVESNHAGFSGTATVAIRFANGTLVRDEQAFNSTGAWPNWTEVTFTVPLNAGSNTIRATATTATGGPNLDRLTIS